MANLKVGYSTWESTLTIESVFNSDYGPYQCLASNELGNDTFNISLTGKARPEPPVNLEVTMTEDQKTVRLRVSHSVSQTSRPRKLCLTLNPRHQTAVSLFFLKLNKCLSVSLDIL